MNAIQYKNTAIFGSHVISAVEYAAAFLASDEGISRLEAYCHIRGIEVKTAAPAVVKVVKTAVKVVKTNKLRKAAATHRRCRKVTKVARTAGLVLFKHEEVTINPARQVRAEKAKTILNRVVKATAKRIKRTEKEVLDLDPAYLFRADGEVKGVFADLAKAFKTAKALMA